MLPKFRRAGSVSRRFRAPSSPNRSWRLLFVVSLLLPACQQSERLNGGGSSFIYPVMLKWTRVYAKDTAVQVDYQSTGSGNGIQQMTVRTIDFGCTDAPMTAEQRANAMNQQGAVIHLPLVLGGVVPVYNVPGVPDDSHLRFSGPVLADIFLGDVTHWDDPALQELNPSVKLPNQRILVVGRSDPGGTTAIWADYLRKVRPESWKAKGMNAGTTTRWPAGEAQKGNEGIAGLVRRVPGAIGYVELKYALDVGLEYGDVRNKAGQFIRAERDSVRAAGDSLTSIPDDLTFSLTDADGPDSYPISGASWAVFFRQQPAGRAAAMGTFLRWVTDPERGQKYASELGYAPLPPMMAQRVRAVLDDFAPTH